MAKDRRYDDPCGIARGLNLLGDRWTLLVIRELCFVAKRFSQLRRDLPGISPNVLSQRLDELESAGLVRQRFLPMPAAATVYELTERGQAVEPILIELGRWGSQVPVPGSGQLTTAALLLAFRTTFVPGGAAARYQLVIGGEPYWLAVSGDSINIGSGLAESTDVILEGDGELLRRLAFGTLSLADAEAAGLVVTGRRRVAATFARRFQRPVLSTAG